MGRRRVVDPVAKIADHAPPQPEPAPPESQAFLLVGAVVLIPMILACTAYAYWTFRGGSYTKRLLL